MSEKISRFGSYSPAGIHSATFALCPLCLRYISRHSSCIRYDHAAFCYIHLVLVVLALHYIAFDLHLHRLHYIHFLHCWRNILIVVFYRVWLIGYVTNKVHDCALYPDSAWLCMTPVQSCRNKGRPGYRILWSYNLDEGIIVNQCNVLLFRYLWPYDFEEGITGQWVFEPLK
jgi:hypothetical protein